MTAPRVTVADVIDIHTRRRKELRPVKGGHKLVDIDSLDCLPAATRARIERQRARELALLGYEDAGAGLLLPLQ